MSESTFPVAEIDVSILREMMEAGNELAAVADNNAQAIALSPREERQLAKIIARWEAALFAIGKAVV